MKRFIDKTSTGKTRKLMEYANDNELVFVCRNPERAKQKAIKYGLTKLECASYADFLDGSDKCAIDDLEDFLHFTLGEQIQAYTLTMED